MGGGLCGSCFIKGATSHFATRLDAIIDGVADVSTVGAGQMWCTFTWRCGAELSVGNKHGWRVVRVGIEPLVSTALVEFLLGLKALNDGGQCTILIEGQCVNRGLEFTEFKT
jgi:hypothetical protein